MEKRYQNSMNIWVKLELDLDPLEHITTEDDELDNIDINDGSKISSNNNSDIVYSDEPSSEFVLPDNIPNETEFSKVNIPEMYDESSSARILELERIINEQRAEIEQLRKQRDKCICRANKIEKKNKPKPVKTCVDNHTAQQTKKLRLSTQEIVKKTDQCLNTNEEVELCPVCGFNVKLIKRNFARLRHLRNCRDKPTFKCSKCNKQWTRKDKLVTHSKTCRFLKKEDISSVPN